MFSSRDAFYREALRCPPSAPSQAPVVRFGPFSLRVPRKDAALHEIIKEAHKIVECKVSHQDEYEEALRSETARLVEAHPVFWARVWPAGLALARFVIAKPTLVAGTNTLEIGAGLGPGAIAAALAGATRVVATDIEPNALDFVAQSARDNSVAVETAAWDWNQRPPPLARGPFDVILAGDVLYHNEHARLIHQHLTGPLLKPGGLVIFSDSLERPNQEERTSELCRLLDDDSFQRAGCHHIDVGSDGLGDHTAVAAGRKVRLLLYCRAAGSRAHSMAG